MQKMELIIYFVFFIVIIFLSRSFDRKKTQHISNDTYLFYAMQIFEQQFKTPSYPND